MSSMSYVPSASPETNTRTQSTIDSTQEDVTSHNGPEGAQISISNLTEELRASNIGISSNVSPLSDDSGCSIGQKFHLPNIENDEVGNDFPVEVCPNGRYIKLNCILGKGAYKVVWKALDLEDGIEVAWNSFQVRDGKSIKRREVTNYRSTMLHGSTNQQLPTSSSSSVISKDSVKDSSGSSNAQTAISNTYTRFIPRTSKQEISELSQEIEILKKVRHPNIISFRDSWYHNGEFVFITELMNSGTLREYIKHLVKPNLKIIRQWTRQILKGLLYLHSHQPPIIHRDIKCDNIFINGSHGEVKIGDMGTAKMKIGKKYSVIGTPEFMAPEMYEETGYNEKVDVYAFGMCLLELVTGEYPYSECKNAAQIYKKVTSGQKPDCIYRVQDEELLHLIKACLAPEHERPSIKQIFAYPFYASEPDVILLAVDEQRYYLTLQVVFRGPVKSPNVVPADLHPGQSPVIGGSMWSSHTSSTDSFSGEGSCSKSMSVKFEYHIGCDTPEEVVDEMIAEQVLPAKYKTYVINEMHRVTREFHTKFPFAMEYLQGQTKRHESKQGGTSATDTDALSSVTLLHRSQPSCQSQPSFSNVYSPELNIDDSSAPLQHHPEKLQQSVPQYSQTSPAFANQVHVPLGGPQNSTFYYPQNQMFYGQSQISPLSYHQQPQYNQTPQPPSVSPSSSSPMNIYIQPQHQHQISAPAQHRLQASSIGVPPAESMSSSPPKSLSTIPVFHGSGTNINSTSTTSAIGSSNANAVYYTSDGFPESANPATGISATQISSDELLSGNIATLPPSHNQYMLSQYAGSQPQHRLYNVIAGGDQSPSSMASPIPASTGLPAGTPSASFSTSIPISNLSNTSVLGPSTATAQSSASVSSGIAVPPLSLVSSTILRLDMPIEEFVAEVASHSNRGFDKASEWITRLREQDIITVADLKALHEADWDGLNLTVFASRALKNALTGRSTKSTAGTTANLGSNLPPPSATLSPTQLASTSSSSSQLNSVPSAPIIDNNSSQLLSHHPGFHTIPLPSSSLQVPKEGSSSISSGGLPVNAIGVLPYQQPPPISSQPGSFAGLAATQSPSLPQTHVGPVAGSPNVPPVHPLSHPHSSFTAVTSILSNSPPHTTLGASLSDVAAGGLHRTLSLGSLPSTAVGLQPQIVGAEGSSIGQLGFLSSQSATSLHSDHNHISQIAVSPNLVNSTSQQQQHLR